LSVKAGFDAIAHVAQLLGIDRGDTARMTPALEWRYEPGLDNGSNLYFSE
jgi:hypothetical protein